jgi:hypothetical protein
MINTAKLTARRIVRSLKRQVRREVPLSGFDWIAIIFAAM